MPWWCGRPSRRTSSGKDRSRHTFWPSGRGICECTSHRLLQSNCLSCCVCVCGCVCVCVSREREKEIESLQTPVEADRFVRKRIHKGCVDSCGVRNDFWIRLYVYPTLGDACYKQAHPNPRCVFSVCLSVWAWETLPRFRREEILVRPSRSFRQLKSRPLAEELSATAAPST